MLPRNPWSNAFLLLGFATLFVSVGLTWDVGTFGGEQDGVWFFRREFGEISYGDSAIDYCIRVGENRLMVALFFLPPIAYFWSRHQHLFFLVSAGAGFAMSVLDFQQFWYDQRDWPGHWVWCA